MADRACGFRKPMLEQNLYELLRVLAGKLNFPASCSLHPPCSPSPIESFPITAATVVTESRIFFFFFFLRRKRLAVGRKKQKKEKKYFSNNRVRRAACFDRLTRPDRLFELALYVAPYVNCVRSIERIRTWMRLVKTPVDDGLTHGEESKLNRIECKSYEDVSTSWLLPREEKIWFGNESLHRDEFLGESFSSSLSQGRIHFP